MLARRHSRRGCCSPHDPAATTWSERCLCSRERRADQTGRRSTCSSPQPRSGACRLLASDPVEAVVSDALELAPAAGEDRYDRGERRPHDRIDLGAVAVAGVRLFWSDLETSGLEVMDALQIGGYLARAGRCHIDRNQRYPGGLAATERAFATPPVRKAPLRWGNKASRRAVS